MAIPDHASKQSYESDNDDDAFMKCVAPSEIATEDAQPGWCVYGRGNKYSIAADSASASSTNSNDGAGSFNQFADDS